MRCSDRSAAAKAATWEEQHADQGAEPEHQAEAHELLPRTGVGQRRFAPRRRDREVQGVEEAEVALGPEHERRQHHEQHERQHGGGQQGRGEADPTPAELLGHLAAIGEARRLGQRLVGEGGLEHGPAMAADEHLVAGAQRSVGGPGGVPAVGVPPGDDGDLLGAAGERAALADDQAHERDLVAAEPQGLEGLTADGGGHERRRCQGREGSRPAGRSSRARSWSARAASNDREHHRHVRATAAGAALPTAGFSRSSSSSVSRASALGGGDVGLGERGRPIGAAPDDARASAGSAASRSGSASRPTTTTTAPPLSTRARATRTDSRLRPVMTNRRRDTLRTAGRLVPVVPGAALAGRLRSLAGGAASSALPTFDPVRPNQPNASVAGVDGGRPRTNCTALSASSSAGPTSITRNRHDASRHATTGRMNSSTWRRGSTSASRRASARRNSHCTPVTSSSDAATPTTTRNSRSIGSRNDGGSHVPSRWSRKAAIRQWATTQIVPSSPSPAHPRVGEPRCGSVTGEFLAQLGGVRRVGGAEPPDDQVHRRRRAAGRRRRSSSAGRRPRCPPSCRRRPDRRR